MNRHPNRRQWTLAATATLAAIPLFGCQSQSDLPLEGMDLTGAEHGKDFPLFDPEGRQRSIQDFAGKVVVVFFGYVQCPDVCPTTLQELVEAKALLGPLGERLHGVFITVDPERDTPEILKSYTQNFSSDFVGLTGTPRTDRAGGPQLQGVLQESPGQHARHLHHGPLRRDVHVRPPGQAARLPPLRPGRRRAGARRQAAAGSHAVSDGVRLEKSPEKIASTAFIYWVLDRYQSETLYFSAVKAMNLVNQPFRCHSRAVPAFAGMTGNPAAASLLLLSCPSPALSLDTRLRGCDGAD